MSYQTDHRLGKLFSHHRFLDTFLEADDPTRSHIRREGEELRLEREFTDQEWAAREAAVQARWKREAQDLVAETHQLMQDFLAALPGPKGDPVPLWDMENQKILQDWLKIPRLCLLSLRTFPRSITDGLLDQVPPSERKKYKKDLPALVVRWIIDDAQRAYQDPRTAPMLRKLSQRGPSARFLLLLSFVPTRLFRALFVRMALEEDRRRLAPVIKRYRNIRTGLSYTDPFAADLLRLRAAGDPLLRNATDAEIKQILCEGCRRLPRAREQEIYAALGLDKGARTQPSRQRIWDLVALPLLDYMEQFVTGRKDDPRVIPERLFWLSSELLALRSEGLWQNVSSRLKNRWYYRLSRTA